MNRILSIIYKKDPQNRFDQAREVVIKGAKGALFTTRGQTEVADITITGKQGDMVSLWLDTKENTLHYLASKEAGKDEWLFLDLDEDHILAKEPSEREKLELEATREANHAQFIRMRRASRIKAVFGCFPWVRAWYSRKVATEAQMRFPDPQPITFKIRNCRDQYKTVQTERSKVVIDMIDYNRFDNLRRPKPTPGVSDV